MSSSLGPARLACSTCRRQKRRCTRERPACELCRRSRRQCQYPPEELDGPGHGQNADAPPRSSSSSSSIVTATSTRDPATTLFFLDSYLFGLSHSAVQRPPVDLPPEGRGLLDDEAAVQHDVAVYFARIHPTFPVVSKLRLRLELASPDRPADTLLLLLVMRLLCRSIEPDGDAATLALFYARAKRCAAHVDAAGLLSVRRLQACLLLGHHEIAQALYPAAYMTIGTCARLGQAMGLHSRRDVVHIPRQRLSLVECEESDRVWWATVILDRFINIGLDDRPLACRDARPDENLPMDETAWETGESAIRPSLAVTADAFVAAPPFARTCQAAHLLTRALHHVNTHLDLLQDYTAFYHEALLLNRILQAFSAAMWQEIEEAVTVSDSIARVHPPGSMPATTLFPGFALSLSALLSFYDVHACVEVDHPGASGLALQLEMQAAALEGAKALLGTAAAFARLVRRSLGNNHDETAVVSPLVSNCLYQTAKTLFIYHQETGRQDVFELMQDVKAALQDLGKLWPIANEYLSILDLDCLRTVA